ncbi:aldo/keto reductase [Isoptericola croceus]|uniref:aldo/keto reductase n=1 Tax=Isoptericola croceus TaxID=3031406 RepID=UPI0023F7ADF5|nr:aldo/keto reductase [Isoptericola croceus]
MRARTIGRRGVAVTELGFGAATLGNLSRATPDSDVSASIATAVDAGIHYFDTAPHYGLGLSERRLGAALAGAPDVVLSTKVGRLLEPNPAPTGSDLAAGGFDVPDDLIRRFDFTRDGVRRSLETSLDRLGVDRVDVVYLHDPDDHAEDAVRYGMPALAELRDQGVIGAIGVGMNQWQLPLRLVEETDVDVVMLAGRWSLLDRSGEPLLDACAERDVSVVAAAPYNSGLLARPRPPADATFDYQRADPAVLHRAHTMADACERHGVSLPEVALQFPLRHPAVVSVVAGMRTAAQVSESVRRFSVPVPEALWAELDS